MPRTRSSDAFRPCMRSERLFSIRLSRTCGRSWRPRAVVLFEDPSAMVFPIPLHADHSASPPPTTAPSSIHLPIHEPQGIRILQQGAHLAAVEAVGNLRVYLKLQGHVAAGEGGELLNNGFDDLVHVARRPVRGEEDRALEAGGQGFARGRPRTRGADAG